MMEENNIEHICITYFVDKKDLVLPSGMYLLYIHKMIE